MNRPRRRGKVIFATNHAAAPPRVPFLFLKGRQVHGQPAMPSHAHGLAGLGRSRKDEDREADVI